MNTIWDFVKDWWAMMLIVAVLLVVLILFVPWYVLVATAFVAGAVVLAVKKKWFTRSVKKRCKAPANWPDPRPLFNLAFLFGAFKVSEYVANEISVLAGIGAFIILITSAFLQGWREIKVTDKEYNVGVLTFFRRPYPCAPISPGFNFYLLYKIAFGFIPVDITKVDVDQKKQTIMTPKDRIQLTVPLSYTLLPNHKNGHALINYLKSGKAKGVTSLIDNISAQKLREWGMSEEEGPQTWHQAMSSGDEASASLLKRILGEELTPVDPEQWLPNFLTSDLLAYFVRPRRLSPKDNTPQLDRCGANWTTIETAFTSLTSDQQKAIRDQVEARRKAIQNVASGKGHFDMFEYGVFLSRLNLGEISPDEHVIEDAESEERERLQQQGQQVEADNMVALMAKYMAAGLSADRAADLALQQVEKAKGTITRIDSPPGVPIIVNAGGIPSGGSKP